jgi:hypothetical protein
LLEDDDRLELDVSAEPMPYANATCDAMDAMRRDAAVASGDGDDEGTGMRRGLR